MDDLDEWLGTVEKEVSSKDCGVDLSSVGRLMKALQDLEEVVDGHRERFKTLVNTAKNLCNQGNFMAKEIQKRVAKTINR